jgi:hypothetical protein
LKILKLILTFKIWFKIFLRLVWVVNLDYINIEIQRGQNLSSSDSSFGKRNLNFFSVSKITSIHH